MNKTPANREACPACGGNGFVTIVRELHCIRYLRADKRLKLASPERTIETPAGPEREPLYSSNGPTFLAALLLGHYARDYVAEIFRSFSEDDSRALSRRQWQAVAQTLAQVAT